MSRTQSRRWKMLLSPLKAVWYKSWTKALGYTQAGSAAALGTLSYANNYLNDGHFKEYLSNFDIPKWAIIALATLGLITWLAHGREDA